MKNGKNIINLYRRLFLHKTNKNMYRKPGVKCFVHSRVWRHLLLREYDVTYSEFKTLQLSNFVKSDRNATKLCARLFLHKIDKSMPYRWMSGFGLRSPLNYRPSQNFVLFYLPIKFKTFKNNISKLLCSKIKHDALHGFTVPIIWCTRISKMK